MESFAVDALDRMASQEDVDGRGRPPERVDGEVDLCDGLKMVVELRARFVLAFGELRMAQRFVALERFRVHSSEVQKVWKHDDHRLVVLPLEMGCG